MVLEIYCDIQADVLLAGILHQKKHVYMINNKLIGFHNILDNIHHFGILDKVNTNMKSCSWSQQSFETKKSEYIYLHLPLNCNFIIQSCTTTNMFTTKQVLQKWSIGQVDIVLDIYFHKWKLIWITALLLGSRFVIKCTNRIIFLLYNCIQKFWNTKYVFWRLKMNILLSNNLELQLKILL